jgi:hypothetical protein
MLERTRFYNIIPHSLFFPNNDNPALIKVAGMLGVTGMKIGNDGE